MPRACDPGWTNDPADLEFADRAVSGTKAVRQGLDALLAAAEAGRFQVLYFESLSRLARESVISTVLINRLVHRCGVRVISIDENLDSASSNWQLLAAIFGFQHGKFISDLGDHVRRGQKTNRELGFSAGDYCFGYRSELMPGTEQGRDAKPKKKYVIEPEQAEWVRKIFRWYVGERRPIQWIIRQLNELRVPKDHRSRTERWSRNHIRGILMNTKYIGIWTWGKPRNNRDPETGQILHDEVPESEWQSNTKVRPELRIIDDETFGAAQDRLEADRDRFAGLRDVETGTLQGSPPQSDLDRPRHLLAGLLYCGQCGSRLRVQGADGMYMGCPHSSGGTCDRRTAVNRARATKMILAEVSRRILSDEDWREAVAASAVAAEEAARSETPQQLTSLQRAIEELDLKIKYLVDQVEKGEAPEDLSLRLTLRRRERDDLGRQLERLQASRPAGRQCITRDECFAELVRLHEVIEDDAPTAAIALSRLLDHRVEVQEIRVPGRKRHHVELRFRMCIAGILTNPDGVPTASSAASALTDEIVLDLRQPTVAEARADEAGRLLDSGLTIAQIGQELGVSRVVARKAVAASFEQRGLPAPDLRKRSDRLTLPKKLAAAAKDLELQGLLYDEIAQRLECDPNVVTASIAYFHQSRGEAVPDGRTRRKTLSRKTRGRKSSREIDETIVTHDRSESNGSAGSA